MLVFGPFSLDVAEEQLWKHDTLLPLRRKPFAILSFLTANPRRLVTHAELIEHVWSGAAVSDSAVRTHLHELRQVLGEGLIETVIGRGYRFTVQPTTGEIAPVVVAETETMVGRVAELAVLRSALDRASSGHRQLCFVTGEPGIGKSTLVEAFVTSANAVVVRGHCIEQQATPEAFLAVIEVLSQLRRSTVGELALASLIRHAPTFLAQLPHLVPDEQLAEVTKRARSGPDARSVRELIEALEVIATNQTIVVVLEDLQWCDVATIDLLAQLGQRRERARLLVIGTARRADVQTVGHPLNHTMRNLLARFGAIAVPLERIAGSEVQHLIDRRFPDHQFPAALIQILDRITAGIPLFVVSFLDELVGRGMLAMRADKWELTCSIDEIAAHRPDNVRQLIDMHLDRLTASEQRMLEAASAIGIEFSSELVAAALGLPPETIDELCDALARRSLFLRRVGIDEWPDGTVAAKYGMTHGLVQEVSLGRSPPARRQRWHQQIAERLEAAYGDNVAEVSHTLARHFDLGGVPARAVSYYVIAAARSTLRFASRDALALFERSHALIQRMPASRERDVTELALLEGKTQSLIRNTAHTVRAPLEIFEQMIAISRRLGDADRVATTLANFRVRLVTLGEFDRADEVAAQLEAMPKPLPPAALALDTMGHVLTTTWRGQLERACSVIERELGDWKHSPIVPGMIGPTDSKSIFVVQLSIVHWLLGQPRAAELDIDRAVERATASGDPYMLGHGHVSRARLRFLDGSPADEIRQAARAAFVIPEAEVWHPQSALLVGLADSYERPLSASELDELTVQFRTRSTDFPMGTTYMGLILATAAARSNDVPRARSLIDELIAFARTRGERIVEPELIRMRGTLLEGQERAAAYREAIELARVAHSRSFQLRAALSLAEVDPEGLAAVREALPHIADETREVVQARALLSAS